MKISKTFTRRRRNGTARIQRDSYNSVLGMHKKSSWWELTASVRTRNKGRCEAPLCKNKGNDVHHITPLSRGGTNTPSNFIHLCKSCHAKRHTHMSRFL